VPHGGAGVGRELALAIGSAVHLLLERLPAYPAERHEALAARLLAHGFPGLADEHRRAAWNEAARVLAMPEAASVFGPGSLAEVAAAMPGPGGLRMTGRLDRLVVGPDEVVIVDFKTDRAPPPSAAEVPRGYLAQLGAYRAAVSAAFPGRPVTAALLWTAGPRLMRLDHRLIELAFRDSMADTFRNIDSAAVPS
jgi:ATP-dependent helicase/nuclease subunit A